MRTLVILTIQVAVWAGMSSCLPNVQSVEEKRQQFDRSSLNGRVLLDTPPSDMKPIEAVFGRQTELLGYTMRVVGPEPKSGLLGLFQWLFSSTKIDASAKPRPGSRVQIDFYWKAQTTMAEDYKVFVHGDAVGQKQARIHGDHYPADGKYPTDVWRVGDIIMDTFFISIPPGYGARQLGIYTGLYKGDHRVALTSSGRRPRTSDNRSRAVDIFF